MTLPRPHAGQLRLEGALEGARFGVVMCGRRFGKTKYGVYKACRRVLSGQRVGWFAPTYKYAQEAWRELSSRLRPVAKTVSEQEKRIELLTGGVIEVWTMDTKDPARGREYDLVVIDEAGIVREIDAIWQEAIFPTLTKTAGQALFLGTPKGRTHGFSQMFAKGEQADPSNRWRSVRAATADNPFIPREEIEIARSELPAGVFAQEYEGIPADDGGNPFGLTAIAACVEPLSTEPPAVWGWDFARAQDWTVGVALDAYGKVCQVERWQGKPWGDTVRDVVRLTGRVPATGDSTGIGDAVVEAIQTRGCPMDGYAFTAKSKQSLMQRLAAAIQNRQVGFPAGVLRSELETFTYEYTAHGVRYTAPDGYHDDAVMALALAVYGYDRIMPLVEAMAIPEEPNRDYTDWRTLVGVDPSGEVVHDGQFPVGF
ncbi:MAG: terminase large subunit domain-containing protein [Gemmatimonadaceae bacterium]